MSSNVKWNLIAACCENMGIGHKNDLPWRLRKEYQYFTRMTAVTKDPNLKNAVIMGRKTWDSVPIKFRPLKNRINVVLTKQPDFNPGFDEVIVAGSLEEAVTALSKFSDQIESYWIGGGSGVYEEAMNSSRCHRVYLTRIQKHFDCDTFFPEVDEKVFKETTDDRVPTEEQEEDGIRYRFYVYEKQCE